MIRDGGIHNLFNRVGVCLPPKGFGSIVSWIKLLLHPDDPRVFAIADLCGCTPDVAFVACVDLFFYAVEHGGRDCLLSRTIIRAITDWPDDSLAAALESSDIGWLATVDGGVVFTDAGAVHAVGLASRERQKRTPAFAWLYFLIRDFKVSYVGQTIDLRTRLESHRATKTFDTWWAKRVPYAGLDQLEIETIKRLDPPDNKKHTDRDPSRRKKGVRS